MKVYFAPLESITVYTLRNCFEKHFRGADRYYIPFLSPMGEGRLINKCERDILPENNRLDKEIIPQIISNDVDSTLSLIKRLKDMGYKEVNLNFGCPSGTVTSKEKGSGILRNLERLDSYLDGVCKASPLPISVKTRIGWWEPSEFDAILGVFNKYPLKELIIHPRTAKEMYSGPLHLDVIDGLDKKTKIPVVINGEIKTKDDIEYLKNRFPFIEAVMIGRGFLECPDMLMDEIEDVRRQAIKDYVHELSETYILERGWKNGSFGVKEIWSYIHKRFEISEKDKKALFKEKNLDAFRLIEDKVLSLPLKEIKSTFR
ncbi:MAG: tRNA-dihydrouridine synthase family protein [Bacilli bacterium]|nr:tRNA-dihydrouridine synthase family protein [Bacilli bacterium]